MIEGRPLPLEPSKGRNSVLEPVRSFQRAAAAATSD